MTRKKSPPREPHASVSFESKLDYLRSIFVPTSGAVSLAPPPPSPRRQSRNNTERFLPPLLSLSVSPAAIVYWYLTLKGGDTDMDYAHAFMSFSYNAVQIGYFSYQRFDELVQLVTRFKKPSREQVLSTATLMAINREALIWFISGYSAVSVQSLARDVPKLNNTGMHMYLLFAMAFLNEPGTRKLAYAFWEVICVRMFAETIMSVLPDSGLRRRVLSGIVADDLKNKIVRQVRDNAAAWFSQDLPESGPVQDLIDQKKPGSLLALPRIAKSSKAQLVAKYFLGVAFMTMMVGSNIGNFHNTLKQSDRVQAATGITTTVALLFLVADSSADLLAGFLFRACHALGSVFKKDYGKIAAAVFLLAGAAFTAEPSLITLEENHFVTSAGRAVIKPLTWTGVTVVNGYSMVMLLIAVCFIKERHQTNNSNHRRGQFVDAAIKAEAALEKMKQTEFFLRALVSIDTLDLTEDEKKLVSLFAQNDLRDFGYEDINNRDQLSSAKARKVVGLDILVPALAVTARELAGFSLFGLSANSYWLPLLRNLSTVVSSVICEVFVSPDTNPLVDDQRPLLGGLRTHKKQSRSGFFAALKSVARVTAVPAAGCVAEGAMGWLARNVFGFNEEAAQQLALSASLTAVAMTSAVIYAPGRVTKALL